MPHGFLFSGLEIVTLLHSSIHQSSWLFSFLMHETVQGTQGTLLGFAGEGWRAGLWQGKCLTACVYSWYPPWLHLSTVTSLTLCGEHPGGTAECGRCQEVQEANPHLWGLLAQSGEIQTCQRQLEFHIQMVSAAFVSSFCVLCTHITVIYQFWGERLWKVSSSLCPGV